MGKQHVRKYQTRFHAEAIYSRAIRASRDFVFFQGQTGVDFEGVHHCSTGVVAKGLAVPELLVEIDAFAVIDR